MATLYLHIGTPKTGTTAIQRFCDKNRAALARRGYDYPLIPHKYRDVALARNAHFLWIMEQASDGSFASPKEERAWHRRMEWLAKRFKRFENIVLSDESLWNGGTFVSPGVWLNLKRAADQFGFKLRIIIYLRRQDQFISSLWAMRIKKNSTEIAVKPWEEALAQAESWIVLDYHRRLEEIASLFGRDAIDVRVYDRERFPDGNVIPDFLNALGLPLEKDYQLNVGDDNPSIGGNALELKRILNALPDIDPKKAPGIRRAAEACYLRERERVRYSLFTGEELRAFLAKYEESNRLLSRNYLGGGDASPFPPPEEPKFERWRPDNPDVGATYWDFIEAYMTQPDDTPAKWLGRFLRRNLQRGGQAIDVRRGGSKASK